MVSNRLAQFRQALRIAVLENIRPVKPENFITRCSERLNGKQVFVGQPPAKEIIPGAVATFNISRRNDRGISAMRAANTASEFSSGEGGISIEKSFYLSALADLVRTPRGVM